MEIHKHIANCEISTLLENDEKRNVPFGTSD